MLRERYSDHIHSREILDVLSLNSSLACLLDLRMQSVTLNQEMQNAFQLEDTDLSFSQWVTMFHNIDQYEIQKALDHLLTEESSEKTVQVTRQDSHESYHCKMIHLTNGQVVFTLSQSTYLTSFPNQPTKQQSSNQYLSEQHDHQVSNHALKYLNRNRLNFTPKDIQIKDFAINLIDKFPHGLAVINYEWEIIYSNSKMKEITGLVYEDEYKKILWDAFPIADYYTFYQHYFRAMETQKTIEFEGFIDKTDTFVKMTVHPTDKGITIFAQDITQYKHHLQALEESEERFANLANNMKDVFWISDPCFNYVHYISPSFNSLFGFGREEVFEDPRVLRRIIHESDKEKVCEAIDLMKKHKHQVEYRIKGPNGEEKWIRTKGFPVENNQKQYVLGIHEDVTEFKEIVKLKEKSQQLSTITQMSAGIAHEIKNPLTSIKGFLQIGAANPELRDNYQDIILDEVNRIEAIVQDFMMLSKPKASVQKEEVHPNTVVSYVLRLLEPEAASKNVELSGNDLFHEQMVMMTEPKRLNQILVNLVKNAIDASDNGGEVIISGDLIGNDLTISVSDSGPGLSTNALEKIGEPFYTTKEKGTGLGVMVTKKLVADLEGSIKYHSQIGEGTCVTIQLPK